MHTTFGDHYCRSSAWPERCTAALYAMPPAPTAMPATTRAVVLSCRVGGVGSGLLRSVARGPAALASACGPAARLAVRRRSEDMVALRRALIELIDVQVCLAPEIGTVACRFQFRSRGRTVSNQERVMIR